MSAPPSAPEFEIQGRTVRLPVEVRSASTGNATYLIDAHAARGLLPADELDVVELLPGRALLSIGCIDYRDNDLGDYDEISIALFVRERRAPRGLPILGPVMDVVRGNVATWIHRLPVNQSFTCEAGCRIWGFPKVVHDIDIRAEGERAVCDWSADGRPVFRFSVPRGGKQVLPDRTLVTYTRIEGVLHRTAFTSGAVGAGFRMGGAELELGTHPIADELRALGLPRRALMTAWMERMHGRFEAPEKWEGGAG
jgi:hypothetical protein